MMMNTRAKLAASTSLVAAVVSLASLPAQAAGTVQQISNFGANPSGIGMYLYTPANVATRPAIVVNPHACHGKGTDVCGPSGAFAQQADKYGFLVVCPSAVSSDGCWDVHSASVLAHDGGGDAAGIVSMVKWVIDNKNGDADRVFVAGHSSGGMMTNVMLGSYPDVFKAGAAYAGVPFACYAQGAVDSLGWNSNCAQGKVTMTGKEWGDLVRAAFPAFAGLRPRIQIWHGTKDDTVFFQNFKEEIKQWTNVLGVSETPTTTENNASQSTWIRTRYADAAGVVWVEAIEETGQPHNLVVDAAAAIHFFGLDQPAASDAGVRDGASDARMGSGGAGGVGGGSGAGDSGGSSGSGGYRDASLAGRDGGDTGGSAGRSASGTTASGGQPAAGSSGSYADAAVDVATSGGAGGSPASAGGSVASGGRSGAGGSGASGFIGAGGSKPPSTSAAKSSGCSTSSGSGAGACWAWLVVAWACARRWSRKSGHSPSSATASRECPPPEQS
jgi:acetylxylan esterase